jgi:hypothetical protein
VVVEVIEESKKIMIRNGRATDETNFKPHPCRHRRHELTTTADNR